MIHRGDNLYSLIKILLKFFIVLMLGEGDACCNSDFKQVPNDYEQFLKLLKGIKLISILELN